MYSNVPKMVVPMFWFKQTAQLTEELASETKVIKINLRFI